MTPDELMSFHNQGGVFRSSRGAPLAANDTQHNLGLISEFGKGKTDEGEWRRFFGEKGRFQQAAMPVRPVPDVKSPMQTNPNAMMGDTHPGWMEVARQRTSFQDPLVNRMANADPSSPDNPTVLSQPDPSAAVAPLPTPAAAPDLSTPDGLMAHAAQTSLSYLQGNSPQMAMSDKYGKGFSHTAGDNSVLPDWTDTLPTI